MKHQSIHPSIHPSIHSSYLYELSVDSFGEHDMFLNQRTHNGERGKHCSEAFNENDLITAVIFIDNAYNDDDDYDDDGDG